MYRQSLRRPLIRNAPNRHRKGVFTASLQRLQQHPHGAGAVGNHLLSGDLLIARQRQRAIDHIDGDGIQLGAHQLCQHRTGGLHLVA